MSLTTLWMRMTTAGVVAATPIGSCADAADLAVGSNAPRIDIEHWIQTREGTFKPVTEFASGRV